MTKATIPTPDLSILIPTKDRQAILEVSLQKLIPAAKNFNVEIIIINDSESDLNLSAVSTLISIFNNPKSGVASARNLGAKKAQSDILLFLDDDMLIYQENIQYIIDFHRMYANCFLNLNWIYPPETIQQIDSFSFGRYLKQFGFVSLKGWNKGNSNWNDDYLFETNGITSQNLSVRKETFFNNGTYNENFPYAGFEDHEFSSRIRQLGHKIYIEPGQMMHHNEIDRLNLSKWLSRKYRGGITRRVAVFFGYDECKITVSNTKKLLVQTTSPFINKIEWFISGIFKYEVTDRVFFVIVNKLLAMAIFRGYFSNEAKSLIQKLSEKK